MPILRDFFLAMSTNPAMRNFVVRFPLSKRFSHRFVAGETLEEAIQVVKRLNEQGLKVTFDQLGESVTQASEAREAKDGYLRALDAIAANKVSSHVSVKLTQMGLDQSHDLCLENMRQIVSKARAIGTFVRIDMEDTPYTDKTINLYCQMRQKGYTNTGIALQMTRGEVRSRIDI